ncbi:MAG: hypothetical protein RLZZ258_1433 [Actinomycetota bacterium]
MENCPADCGLENQVQKLPRRSLLVGLAGALAAIGIGSESASAAKTYTLGKKSLVPLKSGKLFRVGGQSIFVTQPSAGVFRAFNALCTHQGGIINKVSGSNMICPSHGARFDANTGNPAGGPAKRALAKIKITVSGNELKVTL